uniref:Uncharacterized protein n=1 Tax=virus sp. ctPLL24 TaxID=2826802 RepID=A0A8S5QZB9_9VIRU|nr:MAG TPA: hypothetical protein [virus sp. ctPLL24]DAO04839.1 MAG TPA: hypothetical protein [Caudoviricetes sp.]
MSHTLGKAVTTNERLKKKGYNFKKLSHSYF